jgi:uridine kinase
VVAEGIFAHHVVAPLRSAGLLAAAYCLRQHPMVTFWRRLSRDLREHRKPPLVLVRRGIALMHDQRRIVAEAVAAGCTAVSADEGYALVQKLPVSR